MEDTYEIRLAEHNAIQTLKSIEHLLYLSIRDELVEYHDMSAPEIFEASGHKDAARIYKAIQELTGRR